MNSKPCQSNSSNNKGRCQFPDDGCDHSISTSLRDLRNKYEELTRKQVDSIDANKKNKAEVFQKTKSDKT